eukprot:PhM_4_TR17988/c0_g1_i1/m.80969
MLMFSRSLFSKSLLATCESVANTLFPPSTENAVSSTPENDTTPAATHHTLSPRLCARFVRQVSDSVLQHPEELNANLVPVVVECLAASVKGSHWQASVPPQVCELIAASAGGVVDNLSPWDCGSLLLQLHKIGVRGGDVCKVIASRACGPGGIENASASRLTEFLHVLGNMSDDVEHHVLDCAMLRLNKVHRDLSPRHVAKMLRSLRKLEVETRSIIDVLFLRFVHHAPEFDAHDVARMTWLASRFRVTDMQVVGTVLEHSGEVCRQWNVREIVTVCRSLMLLQKDSGQKDSLRTYFPVQTRRLNDQLMRRVIELQEDVSSPQDVDVLLQYFRTFRVAHTLHFRGSRPLGGTFVD